MVCTFYVAKYRTMNKICTIVDPLFPSFLYHHCLQIVYTTNFLRENLFISCINKNVHTEPTLQPLQGEHLKYKSANGEVGARLDVAAQNFCGKDHQTAYFVNMLLKTDEGI